MTILRLIFAKSAILGTLFVLFSLPSLGLQLPSKNHPQYLGALSKVTGQIDELIDDNRFEEANTLAKDLGVLLFSDSKGNYDLGIGVENLGTLIKNYGTVDYGAGLNAIVLIIEQLTLLINEPGDLDIINQNMNFTYSGSNIMMTVGGREVWKRFRETRPRGMNEVFYNVGRFCRWMFKI